MNMSLYFSVNGFTQEGFDVGNCHTRSPEIKVKVITDCEFFSFTTMFVGKMTFNIEQHTRCIINVILE